MAQFLKITLPAVTNLSNKLVDGGYIERIHSESDRRLILLQITHKGLDFLNVIDKTGRTHQNPLGNLSSEEVQQLNPIFKKY